MRLYSLKLAVPSNVGAGGAQRVRDLTGKYVQIIGAFTGSLTVEVSLDDGNNFVASGGAITAPGIVEVKEPATHMRLRATSMSGTAPTAVVAGFNYDG
jgi:hypothetical protein